MNKKGFTLIELLVVIAIIGLLAGISVVALNSARQKARDVRRVADIRQIQTALAMYYDSASKYPSSLSVGDPIIGGSPTTTFMNVIPSNPSPKNDGGCPDSDYVYTAQNNASSYTIRYCLGGLSGGIGPGPATATPASLDDGPH